ncbi:hypothetical protein ACEPPN_005686 [Leptodophora sp. 'Broadleaf-Isolate-01']
MAANLTLLQGGTLLIHGGDNHVKAVKADLLIEGNIISKIEAKITPSTNTQVIDCTDKIISPGFIDTHHHLWQTLLKGRHANETLIDYFPSGNFPSSLHSPADMFWGELGGCLECLDVGTTTVVDHAHLNYSPEHSKAAIAATMSSGIRSVFCYSATPRLESWEPFKLNHDLLPSWVLGTLEELVAKNPIASGRVQLGFAFDSTYLPKEMIVATFEKVKSLGIKLITTHYVGNGHFGGSPVELYHNYGLLDSSILFSHATGASANDAKLLLQTNSHVSTTPSTEMQMGHGRPVAFSSELKIESHCGVGADCHANNSASIISELRLLLQSARSSHAQKFAEVGKTPKKVYKTVEEAFNLGTIGGARAINMEDKLGSLKVGKFADILVWDAMSSGMVCASQFDPVAAVVLHSSPADLEMVIVDGVVKKSEWMLKDIDLSAGREMWSGEEGVKSWRDIAKELVKRRTAMQEKVDQIDMEAAKKGVMKAFYIDESTIVDEI